MKSLNSVQQVLLSSNEYVFVVQVNVITDLIADEDKEDSPPKDMKQSPAANPECADAEPCTSKHNDQARTMQNKMSSEKPSSDLKNESDSETQNTTYSEESSDEHKPVVLSPVKAIKVLDSTIAELLIIVEKKA